MRPRRSTEQAHVFRPTASFARITGAVREMGRRRLAGPHPESRRAAGMDQQKTGTLTARILHPVWLRGSSGWGNHVPCLWASQQDPGPTHSLISTTPAGLLQAGSHRPFVPLLARAGEWRTFKLATRVTAVSQGSPRSWYGSGEALARFFGPQSIPVRWPGSPAPAIHLRYVSRNPCSNSCHLPTNTSRLPLPPALTITSKVLRHIPADCGVLPIRSFPSQGLHQRMARVPNTAYSWFTGNAKNDSAAVESRWESHK